MQERSAPDPGSLWTRPVRGSRGPQPEHSRGQVARAAIALADSGGLAAVTMRAVAHELGTSAGSLYRYVLSRDELLQLMVDQALGGLRLPAVPGEGWRDQLVGVAHEQLRLHQQHPWMVEASFRPGPLGPNALRYFDQCLAILSDLPNSTTAKMETLAMINGVVTLFARPAPTTATAARLFSAADAGTHPHLMAALTRTGAGSAQPDLFDRTIRSLLVGLLPS